MPENYVFLLVLIKVDYKDITLSRLCYYLSESTNGTNTKTMFCSLFIGNHTYIYIVANVNKRKQVVCNTTFSYQQHNVHSVIYALLV